MREGPAQTEVESTTETTESNANSDVFNITIGNNFLIISFLITLSDV